MRLVKAVGLDHGFCYGVVVFAIHYDFYKHAYLLPE